MATSLMLHRAAQKPLVVAGPSGVGKGTLLIKLREAFPGAFGFSVSCTSRAPRPGEVDGKHYYFIPKPQFLEGVAAGKFLEYADNFGNLYGTLLSEVERIHSEGKTCLLEVDVQGVRQIRNSPIGHATNYLFIAPPSIQELEKRLRGRGTESEEKMIKRLSVALDEIESSRNEIPFDRIIVNDAFEVALDELKKHVVKLYPYLAEKQPGNNQKSPEEN